MPDNRTPFINQIKQRKQIDKSPEIKWTRNHISVAWSIIALTKKLSYNVGWYTPSKVHGGVLQYTVLFKSCIVNSSHFLVSLVPTNVKFLPCWSRELVHRTFSSFIDELAAYVLHLYAVGTIRWLVTYTHNTHTCIHSTEDKLEKESITHTRAHLTINTILISGFLQCTTHTHTHIMMKMNDMNRN